MGSRGKYLIKDRVVDAEWGSLAAAYVNRSVMWYPGHLTFRGSEVHVTMKECRIPKLDRRHSKGTEFTDGEADIDAGYTKAPRAALFAF